MKNIEKLRGKEKAYEINRDKKEYRVYQINEIPKLELEEYKQLKTKIQEDALLFVLNYENYKEVKQYKKTHTC